MRQATQENDGRHCPDGPSWPPQEAPSRLLQPVGLTGQAALTSVIPSAVGRCALRHALMSQVSTCIVIRSIWYRCRWRR